MVFLVLVLILLLLLLLSMCLILLLLLLLQDSIIIIIIIMIIIIIIVIVIIIIFIMIIIIMITRTISIIINNFIFCNYCFFYRCSTINNIITVIKTDTNATYASISKVTTMIIVLSGLSLTTAVLLSRQLPL